MIDCLECEKPVNKHNGEEARICLWAYATRLHRFIEDKKWYDNA